MQGTGILGLGIDRPGGQAHAVLAGSHRGRRGGVDVLIALLFTLLIVTETAEFTRLYRDLSAQCDAESRSLKKSLKQTQGYFTMYSNSDANLAFGLMERAAFYDSAKTTGVAEGAFLMQTGKKKKTKVHTVTRAKMEEDASVANQIAKHPSQYSSTSEGTILILRGALMLQLALVKQTRENADFLASQKGVTQ